MCHAITRRILWMMVGSAVLPTSQILAEGEETGRLKYVDSVSELNLNAVNCAAISDDGRFLYVSAWQANSIVVMRRDVSTGGLEHVQTMQSDRDLAGVTHVSLSPDGRLALGSAFRSQTTVLFERDSSTGLLRLLDVAREGEKAVKGLTWAVGGSFSPDAQFLYVCDPKASGVSSAAKEGTKGAITAFRITKNHKLRWIESNVGKDNCFDGARAIVFHPDRKLAFVASTTAHAVVVLDWDDKTGKTTIRQIIYDGQGNAQALAGAMELACSPDGQFLYVSSGRFKGDDAVSVFRLSDEDELVWVEEFVSEQSDLRGFDGGNVICVSPDGRNVYAAGTESNALACFERDAQSGKLTYLETLTSDYLQGAAGLAISPMGEHVYVAAEYADKVAIFKRQRAQ